MDSTQITDVIEATPWIAGPAASLQQAAGTILGPAGQDVCDALHGVWLGHPLHPVLTDIPLGAWTAAAVMDFMEATGNKRVGPGADAAVGVGLVGALGAAAAGIADWYLLRGKKTQAVGGAHAMLNTLAAALYGSSWLSRRRGARGAGRALAWLGLGVSCASAYLGGALVSEMRIGVDHAASESAMPADFAPALPDSELKEGELKEAQVGSAKIVLAGVNGKVYALSDVCSHLAGSLSQGKLFDGCVQCPLHNSVFELATGKVVHGPATFPVPSLETRIDDGRIEVRAVRRNA